MINVRLFVVSLFILFTELTLIRFFHAYTRLMNFYRYHACWRIVKISIGYNDYPEVADHGNTTSV
jgi:hypothetical protein